MRLLPVSVWRRLKPMLEELVREEAVRQTSRAVSKEVKDDVQSGFHLPVQVVVKPDYGQTPCPDCGGPTDLPAWVAQGNGSTQSCQEGVVELPLLAAQGQSQAA
jgi:hypothetical protein